MCILCQHNLTPVTFKHNPDQVFIVRENGDAAETVASIVVEGNRGQLQDVHDPEMQMVLTHYIDQLNARAEQQERERAEMLRQLPPGLRELAEMLG